MFSVKVDSETKTVVLEEEYEVRKLLENSLFQMAGIVTRVFMPLLIALLFSTFLLGVPVAPVTDSIIIVQCSQKKTHEGFKPPKFLE